MSVIDGSGDCLSSVPLSYACSDLFARIGGEPRMDDYPQFDNYNCLFTFSQVVYVTELDRGYQYSYGAYHCNDGDGYDVFAAASLSYYGTPYWAYFDGEGNLIAMQNPPYGYLLSDACPMWFSTWWGKPVAPDLWNCVDLYEYQPGDFPNWWETTPP